MFPNNSIIKYPNFIICPAYYIIKRAKKAYSFFSFEVLRPPDMVKSKVKFQEAQNSIH